MRIIILLLTVLALACQAETNQAAPATITLTFGEHTGGMPIVDVSYTESPAMEAELRDYLRTKVNKPLMFFGGESSWMEPDDGYERFKRIPKNHIRRNAYIVKVMEMHLGDADGILNAASAARVSTAELADIPPGVKHAIWTRVRYGGANVGDTLTVSYDDIGYVELRKINMRDGIIRLFKQLKQAKEGT